MHVSSFQLEALPPYSFELTVHNPAGWYWYNPLEVFSNGRIWAALRLSSKAVVGLRLESLGSVDRPRVLATVFSRQKLKDSEMAEASDMVAECAGLDEDVTEFYEEVREDPVLRYAIEDLYGMKRGAILRSDVFHSAILAITLQNAPIKRTDQMLRLIITNYGQKLFFDGKSTYTWPAPQSIIEATTEELSEKCKVGYRAEYLRSIAEAVCDGKCPTLKELAQMPFEEARAKLMKLKGIGEYSAEVILPHTEAFPVDIWSAQIFWKLFFLKEPMPPKLEATQLVRKHAEKRWGRWRGLAFVYVLSDLRDLSKRLRVNL